MRLFDLRTLGLRVPLVALLGGLSVMACAASYPSGPPLTGDWGGRGLNLTLTADGGKLEYDCAAGTLTGAVHPDSNGEFTATGTHEAFTPGPQNADAKPGGVAAQYVGSVSGSTMILQVQPAGETRMASYTLTQGRRAKLIRCM